MLEAIETDTGQHVLEASAGSTDARAVLRAGALAWVQLAGDPVVQRVLLIDAPSVLGWERWRELEERHALGLIRGVLAAIAEQGDLDAALVDVFSHVILASINGSPSSWPVPTTRYRGPARCRRHRRGPDSPAGSTGHRLIRQSLIA